MITLQNISLAFLCLITFSAAAQTDKQTLTQQLLDAKTYRFVATSATPLNSAEMSAILGRMPGAMGGSNISISGGGYYVQVTPDSIVADLPYYGRAYRPPINRDESGIRFTSTKFTYSRKINKKGNQEITIKLKDHVNAYWLNFNISPNGYASLAVSSNNKQSINYSGSLENLKKE